MMSTLPPYQERPAVWPTLNQMRRKGAGLAVPGRTFSNIALSDLAALVGDILATIPSPFTCAKIVLIKTGKNSDERNFEVFIEGLYESTLPMDHFNCELFEKYVDSFCLNQKKPGQPLELYVETVGTFYELHAHGQ